MGKSISHKAKLNPQIPDAMYILPCRQHCDSRQAHPSAVHMTRRVCQDRSTPHCETDLAGPHRCTPAEHPCAGSAADTTPCTDQQRPTYTVGHKKRSTSLSSISSLIINQFSKSFTGILCRQFAIMQLLYIPPQHECVSTLLYKNINEI